MNITYIIDKFIKQHCKDYAITAYSVQEGSPLVVKKDINNQYVKPCYKIYYSKDVLNEINLNEDELYAALFHELAHIKLGHLNFSWFSVLYGSFYSTCILNFPLLILACLSYLHNNFYGICISIGLVIFNIICWLTNFYIIRSREKQSDLFAIKFVHKNTFATLLAKAQIWHQKTHPSDYLFLNKYNIFSKHPTYKSRIHYVMQ